MSFIQELLHAIRGHHGGVMDPRIKAGHDAAHTDESFEKQRDVCGKSFADHYGKDSHTCSRDSGHRGPCVCSCQQEGMNRAERRKVMFGGHALQ